MSLNMWVLMGYNLTLWDTMGWGWDWDGSAPSSLASCWFITRLTVGCIADIDGKPHTENHIFSEGKVEDVRQTGSGIK